MSFQTLRRRVRGGLALLFILPAVGLLGCHRHRPNRPPVDTGAIGGQLVDLQGHPIGQVTVQVPGQPSVRSDQQGNFSIPNLPATDRLAVSFSAPGFVRTTQIYQVQAGQAQLQAVTLRPRAKPVEVDAATGGRISFAEGGGVTIPPGSLVNSAGKPLTGKVQVSATYLDVTDDAQLRTAPGDFTARMSDASVRQLESYGMAEIFVDDGTGRPAELARGQVAELDLPIPERVRQRAPRRVGLFNFDTLSGRWVEAGTLALQEDLVYSGTIDRFDWSWNADDPTDTVCITVKMIRVVGNPPNQPINGARVTAKGVSYSSISSGYTNSQGLVCLLVKPDSDLDINAYFPAISTDPSIFGTFHVHSPNFSSGAADCGNSVKCPQVIDPIEVDW